MIKVKEFEHHFNVLYMPLCMYVLRICGDLQESEDIVADTFSKAWEYLSDHETPSSFKSYIYRMAHNLTIDRMRTRRPEIELSEVTEIPGDDIDTSERDAAIWNAVGSLPERCRQIFLLSKRDNLTHKEIAKELSISEKTVENQLTKAFKTLRNALDHDPSFHEYSFILTFL